MAVINHKFSLVKYEDGLEAISQENSEFVIQAKGSVDLRRNIVSALEKKLDVKLFRDSFVVKDKSIEVMASTISVTNAEIYGK